MISKTRRDLITVVLANLISVPLLYIATLFSASKGFLIVLIMELIVVIFEAIFIKFILNNVGFRRIIIYSFFANALSAIFGSAIVMILIFGLLKAKTIGYLLIYLLKELVF